MLLLVTIGLVVAGFVLLVIGFVESALGFIYAAILCAAVAGLALVAFSRLSRRRALSVAAAGPDLEGSQAPSGSAQPFGRALGAAEGPPEGAASTALAGSSEAGQAGGRADAEAGEQVTEAVEAVPSAKRSGRSKATRPRPASPPPPLPPPPPVSEEQEGEEEGEEVLFPIEDYDELRVSEILPLLPELYPDELEEVRDRELAGKARATILNRIDALLAASGTARSEDGAVEVPFPIEGYESLRASEILPLLSELTPAELEQVEAAERAGQARATVLNRIARLKARGASGA